MLPILSLSCREAVPPALVGAPRGRARPAPGRTRSCRARRWAAAACRGANSTTTAPGRPSQTRLSSSTASTSARPGITRPPGAGDQGLPRFGVDLGAQCDPLLLGHVGRVRHHEVDAATEAPGSGVSQLPATSSTGGRPRPPSGGGHRPARRQVGGGDRERAGTGVGGPDLPHHRGTELGRQGQCHRTAAGPGVDHHEAAPRARAEQAPRLTESDLDHLLGLGPRESGPAPSTRRSRPRKGQWPKMYCSGSPATRRAAMARAAAAGPGGTVPGRDRRPPPGPPVPRAPRRR